MKALEVLFGTEAGLMTSFVMVFSIGMIIFILLVLKKRFQQ